jgi:transcriptional regulator with XRE-family HTH domain
MSTVEYNFELGGFHAPTPVPAGSAANGQKKLMHRISEVRQEQGVSIRSAARRLGVSMQEVREQEDPACDLRLSQLHQWQHVLEVPLADLVLDSDAPLSTPVSQRAKMLRVMKTVKALAEAASEPSVQRFAQMLITQLVDVMPELKEVSAWHSVGQRRTQDEMGRIIERTIPDSFFGDSTY